MNSLSATAIFLNYPVLHSSKRRRFSNRIPAVFSTLKASPPPPPPPRKCHMRTLFPFDSEEIDSFECESLGIIMSFYSMQVDKYTGDDVLQDFVKERKVSGDFVAKISDELWLKGVFRNAQEKQNLDEISIDRNFTASQLVEEPNDEESEGGFLKLKRTNEWLLGENDSAPVNKKMTLKEIRDDRDRRKRLNFLRYEALKRELFLLTVSIGAACTGYCLVVFSMQAAVSYAVGVSLSCLYFQLLCKHADNLSREMIPQIFTKKKTKKIGIRSEDLQDLFEKSVKGTSIALSSPRLVFPAAIYGLWELSQHFSSEIFEFQLVPAMLGLFAYKAACLVQVYRDNEDLQFIFPEN